MLKRGIGEDTFVGTAVKISPSVQACVNSGGKHFADARFWNVHFPDNAQIAKINTSSSIRVHWYTRICGTGDGRNNSEEGVLRILSVGEGGIRR